MNEVTRRAMELWGPLRTSEVGKMPHSYNIRATLLREFPTVPRQKVAAYALEAIRLVKQTRKQ